MTTKQAVSHGASASYFSGRLSGAHAAIITEAKRQRSPHSPDANTVGSVVVRGLGNDIAIVTFRLGADPLIRYQQTPSRPLRKTVLPIILLAVMAVLGVILFDALT